MGFMSRQVRKGRAQIGTLPSRKPNGHRVFIEDKGSSCCREPNEMPQHLMVKALAGREKINQLFRRAGVELGL